MILKIIVTWEEYDAGLLFQQTFLRVFILRMIAILATLFQTAASSAELAKSAEERGEPTCQQSLIGQMLLKFILTSMATDVVLHLFMPALMFYYSKCTRKKETDEDVANMGGENDVEEKDEKEEEAKELNIEDIRESVNAMIANKEIGFELKGDEDKGELEIPDAIVSVMYGQGIVWCAMYFAPIAPVYACLANAVSFYTIYFHVTRYTKKPKKAQGIVKQLKFFYTCMLLTLTVGVIPFMWMIYVAEEPDCGPIRETSLKATFEGKLELLPPIMKAVINVGTSPIVLLPVIFALLILMKLTRTRYHECKATKNQLQEELNMEKLEKQQILRDNNLNL